MVDVNIRVNIIFVVCIILFYKGKIKLNEYV